MKNVQSYKYFSNFQYAQNCKYWKFHNFIIWVQNKNFLNLKILEDVLKLVLKKKNPILFQE